MLACERSERRTMTGTYELKALPLTSQPNVIRCGGSLAPADPYRQSQTRRSRYTRVPSARRMRSLMMRQVGGAKSTTCSSI
jgi:hypothetical protein